MRLISEGVESIPKVVESSKAWWGWYLINWGISDGIDAENGFLIFENWIRGGMEAGSKYNIRRRLPGGELIV
jgi:hypothetical protein